MVDNCYGEFVDVVEPSDVGADMVVGSLIKNPAWMPAQKAHIAASLPSSTAWMMSWRGSVALGMQRKPRLS